MNYRFFIELQYKGENYKGWQVQPNAHTIQQELNEKLSILLKEAVQVIGAGRTDAGVHAAHFVAHFDCTSDISKKHHQIVKKLNSFLPKDIFIRRIVPVSNTTHSRFDAISRTYKYFITTHKDVFREDYTWKIETPLNVEKMNEASGLLRDFKDFTSFSKLHTDVKTNICEVRTAKWESEGHLLVFTITADRFLRNMVRALTGTLVQVGREKISLDHFREIISVKDRSAAGESAPAHGLFLFKIEYPDLILSPVVHTFF